MFVGPYRQWLGVVEMVSARSIPPGTAGRTIERT